MNPKFILSEKKVIALTTILILLGAVGIFIIKGIPRYFGEVNFEQILFNLMQPMGGAESGVISGVIFWVLGIFAIFIFIYGLTIIIIKKIVPRAYVIKVLLLGVLMCIILLGLLIIKIDRKYEIKMYFTMIENENGFIEENYINGRL